MGGTVREVLTLNADRSVLSGSTRELADAIRRGADLKVGTSFRHNEHIDTGSNSNELIEEVAEFSETLLVEDRWSAGIMTLRVPVELPSGFGPRPSMSFFLYNEDGTQAIARPFLDGQPAGATPGPSPLDDIGDMPKYHQFDAWDAGTNSPSHNFVFDFDVFRYLVDDRWTEVLSHTADGTVVGGSADVLREAFLSGLSIKVAIRGLCGDLADEAAPDHEVFVHAGSCYYYSEQGLFLTGTHPALRIAPSVPLRYGSRNWDFGWFVARTDGHLARWLVDPYTLEFHRSNARHAMRWFVTGG